MIITAIGFFALAAILGMILISYVFQNKNTPKGLVFVHGSIAAIGIVLLIVYIFHHGPGLIASLILFILAAIGGFVMIYRDLTGKTLPKWLAIGHGLIAVLGFISLLIFALI